MQCDACDNWHELPAEVSTSDLPERFDCTMNWWSADTKCAETSEGLKRPVSADSAMEDEAGSDDDAAASGKRARSSRHQPSVVERNGLAASTRQHFSKV